MQTRIPHVREILARDPRFAELDRLIAAEPRHRSGPAGIRYGPRGMPAEELERHAAAMRRQNVGTFRRRAAARAAWARRREEEQKVTSHAA